MSAVSLEFYHMLVAHGMGEADARAVAEFAEAKLVRSRQEDEEAAADRKTEKWLKIALTTGFCAIWLFNVVVFGGLILDFAGIIDVAAAVRGD